MPRSLNGFAEQSLYVGYGLKCRAFTDMWYTTKVDELKVANYSSSVAPSMTPERKALYKIFVLLSTHKESSNRPSYTGGYVKSVEKDLGIDLKRSKLENSMNDAPTSADGILISLSDLYAESINKKKAVTPAKEVEAADDAANEEQAEQRVISKREAIAKKKICPLIGSDVVPKGLQMLEDRNILAVRAERERVSQEKSKLRACITKLANEYKEVTHLDLSSQPAPRPHWQEFVWETPNNLN